MAIFRVRYYECYEGFYVVEANSKEEAEDKLMADISEGREDAPDQCCGSDAEVIEIID